MKQRMLRFFCLALCLVLTVGLFAACATTEQPDGKPDDGANNQPNGDQNNGATDGNNNNSNGTTTSTLGDVLTGFRGNEFKVENETELTENAYGAKYGMKANLNGHPVEIYEYENTLSGKIKEMVDQARTSGEMEINGDKRKVMFNGNYMIAAYDEHPDLEKIEKYFKDYKMK